jgi:hypothetical protein
MRNAFIVGSSTLDPWRWRAWPAYVPPPVLAASLLQQASPAWAQSPLKAGLPAGLPAVPRRANRPSASRAYRWRHRPIADPRPIQLQSQARPLGYTDETVFNARLTNKKLPEQRIIIERAALGRQWEILRHG